MTVLRSGSASDVGRVRTTNQDLALEQDNLFAVADGMGGHAGGEVAARVAVDTLRTAFARQPSVEGLHAAVVEANQAVWAQSQAQPELRGMGTTLTAAALVPGEQGDDVIALANVGDSRAYVYAEGAVTQVTEDHSLAEEKVRHGEMTEAQAAVHPHRHILTRALGVQSGVSVDLWELRLRTGDRIVLCSDGMSNEIGAEQLAEVLGTVADPTEAAEELVARANEHGGNDNITVVVVDVVLGEEGGERDATVAVPLAAVAATAAGAAVLGAAGTGAGASPVAATPGSGSPATATATASTAPAVTGDLTEAVAAVGPDTPLATSGGATQDLFVSTGGGRPMTGSAAATLAPDRPAETAPAPRRETRRERRRRLGVPRRITLRVILFFLLLGGVVAGAYVFVQWYATQNWYVALDGNQLVVYQGRPGGLLWYHPKVVDKTGITTAQVLPIHLDQLQATVQEPTLKAAKDYVASLWEEYLAQFRLSTGAGTVGPTGTIPTLPPPTTTGPSTTTTAPGAKPPTTPTTTPVATTTPTTTPTTTSPPPTAPPTTAAPATTPST